MFCFIRLSKLFCSLSYCPESCCPYAFVVRPTGSSSSKCTFAVLFLFNSIILSTFPAHNHTLNGIGFSSAPPRREKRIGSIGAFYLTYLLMRKYLLLICTGKIWNVSYRFFLAIFYVLFLYVVVSVFLFLSPHFFSFFFLLVKC